MRDSILLIAAALLAFGLSLGGSFHFDDYSLFENPNLTSLTATRPLSNLTFRLNEFAGGQNPIGYHVVNLLLHIASVLLLRSTLARVLPPQTAWIAALIFAVHPIQTEPVNYVFERGTLLATLLCIASLRTWLDGKLWIAVAWFAAALLAKEECVAFPVFLLLLHFSGSRSRAEFGAIGAMLALCVAAGLRVIAATAQVSGTATGFGAHVTPLEYLSMQGIAILRYTQLLVIPWGISIDPELPLAALWLRLAAWLVIAVAAAFALRFFSKLQPGFWLLGALVLLLPSSSIFPVDDLAADRRMYLPMIAISAGLALLAMRLPRHLVTGVLIVFALISLRYSYVWQTEQRLWTEAVAWAPHKARPRLQLARAADSPAAALQILSEAQSIAPADPGIASEQGRMLLSLGRPAEALSAFGRALALAPEDATNISNRAAALLVLGQSDTARQEFERALHKDPCQFNARVNLKRIGAAAPPIPPTCRYTPEQDSQLNP